MFRKITVLNEMFILQEENDVNEFFMILEKDPQQEDFLQGRMLGNPYSCNEPGMGPLMRDIKNKICQGSCHSTLKVYTFNTSHCSDIVRIYVEM